MITARTRLFALLGHPVSHSLSPAIHNAAFAALGLDAAYLALDCTEDLVSPLMAGIVASGGGGNITIPHKGAAARAAREAGANSGPVCNTFWGADGHLQVTNTDPEGVTLALRRLGVVGGAWLVVGTGGSAHGVLAAAREAGASIGVQSRSPERAEQLRQAAVAMGVGLAEPTECDVVINATPLGMRSVDPSPVSLASVPAVRAVLDLVYLRGETALVRAARAAGLAAADGREVLLGQGAASFRCWFPGADPPLEVMRAALDAALG